MITVQNVWTIHGPTFLTGHVNVKYFTKNLMKMINANHVLLLDVAHARMETIISAINALILSLLSRIVESVYVLQIRNI